MGNAQSTSINASTCTVHPHGCGERNTSIGSYKPSVGSSPRLWGTQKGFTGFLLGYRFIPTAVGNATSQADRAISDAVHPHGCGERWYANNPVMAKAGSSPRLWGTPRHEVALQASIRFIPTAVGNASPSLAPVAQNTVHPHGCGERRPTVLSSVANHGSSPRLWGTPGCVWRWVYPCRFIPTAVGNAHAQGISKTGTPVHPHGCGERSWNGSRFNLKCGSSPRLWGTLKGQDDLYYGYRFIPTAVGNAC